MKTENTQKTEKEEMEEAIHEQENRNAPGTNEIVAEVIKFLYEEERV